MVVLVDTNVIIDYYCEREEFYKASKGVMKWCKWICGIPFTSEHLAYIEEIV